MAVKITGYKVFTSSGGNKCVQCNTRMEKDLPYVAPITGKNRIRELTGKSICIACLENINKSVDKELESCNNEQQDKYEKRRFLTHFEEI